MILLPSLRRLTEIKKEGPKANLLYEDLSDGKIGNNPIGTLESFSSVWALDVLPKRAAGCSLPGQSQPGREGEWSAHSPPSPLTTLATPLQDNNLIYSQETNLD